jgi:hypothetical protein
VCVVRSRPPWSQVARKLTSPFPPHSNFFFPRPPRGFPKSIVRPTKTTSWSRLHLVRNSWFGGKKCCWRPDQHDCNGNGNSERNLPLGWPPKMMEGKFLLYTVEKHHGERVIVLGQVHLHAPLDESPCHPLDPGAICWKRCLECQSNTIVLQFWWCKSEATRLSCKILNSIQDQKTITFTSVTMQHVFFREL